MSARRGPNPPGLRFVDLSLTAGEELDSPAPPSPNGLHPHVGYKASKRHPPSPYLYDKGRDVHKRLREDVERAMDDAMLEIHGTPTWALLASREITHSGESPLFVHKYMSPYKMDGDSVPLRPQRSSAKSLPPTCNGHKYYRPNRTHQYLTATELKDQAETDVQLRLGRPTRTSLLRARQRSNSAPMNAYEMHRDMARRIENVKNNISQSISKEVFEFVTEDGMTHHAFLTGARYNRAHCLDSRVLTLYGVYMPRHNPNASFFTGTPRVLLDTPGTPPDSPRSDAGRETQSAPVSRPRTAPNYGKRPLPHPPGHVNGHINGHATQWTDANAGPLPSGRQDNVHEEILVWPYGLSVKGRAMGGGRGQTTTLPSVTGVSVSRMRQVRQSTADALELAMDANLAPMPTPNLNERSEDPQIPADNDSPLAIRTPTTPQPPPAEEEQAKPERPVTATVDRSIMVPSMSGDPDDVKDSSPEDSPQESPSSKEKSSEEEQKAEDKGVQAAAEEQEQTKGDDSAPDVNAGEATEAGEEAAKEEGGMDSKAPAEAGKSEKDGAKADDNDKKENKDDEGVEGSKDAIAGEPENESENNAKKEKNSSLFVRNSAQVRDQSAERAPVPSDGAAPSGDDVAFFITEGENAKKEGEGERKTDQTQPE